VVDIGTALLFVGPDDIYLFNGSLPVSIGSPLREWFFADLDPTYPSRMKSAHDRVNSLVYFYYPRLGASGSLTGCIVYNYKTNKWGVAHRAVEAAVDYITGGYTYDTLPIIGLTWDDWPSVTYDSPYWTSSSRYTSYIGTDHTIYSLTGASASASFTTWHYGVEDLFLLLRRLKLRYLVRPTTATMTNYYTDHPGGTWTEDATTTESSGRFDVLRSSPFHKATIAFTGDVEFAAVDADFKGSGVL
jgi:hypothetical protein